MGDNSLILHTFFLTSCIFYIKYILLEYILLLFKRKNNFKKQKSSFKINRRKGKREEGEKGSPKQKCEELGNLS